MTSNKTVKSFTVNTATSFKMKRVRFAFLRGGVMEAIKTHQELFGSNAFVAARAVASLA